MKNASRSVTKAIVLLIVGLQAQGAYAYLDPGTGSMILQGIVAAVAVAGVTAKHYWYKITSLFGGKQAPQGSLLDDDDTEEESEKTD